MSNNYLALIFPEYDDKENVATSQDWKRNDLPDDESLGKFIKYLCSYVDFYRDEDCNMIYDAKNAASFIFSMTVLSDYYPNREREFRFVLKNLENWRMNRTSSENEEYISKGVTVKDEMRTEIARRMMNNPKSSYLLVVHIPDYVAKEWHLTKGQDTCKIESQPLSIKKTFDWLSTHHSPQRSYNWNPKHGENGKGAHPDHKGEEVSVLLCSKEHAAEIMQMAIGVPMYDTLYCFDPEYGKYMEYKAECKYEHLPVDATTRKYHSYHIANDTLIPNQVKKKLAILQKETGD